MMSFEKTILPEPWYWSKQDLTIQLKKELTINHNLFNIDLKSIACRQDNDDVLYELADGRFAIVHLTWSTPIDSTWPRFQLYDNWENVYLQILKDAEEFDE